MKVPAKMGVNLGGWLILEKWLTPSVFQGITAHDEWTLSQTTEGRERIGVHRKTFLTEVDFRWLRQHGVTFVRLPVPYWAVIDTAEYVSAQAEVQWAMKMAEKYNISVLLDLHAVPGGQNLGDHSGRKGQFEWFDSKAYQDQTIDILRQLAQTYNDSPAFWGIEIINEPEAKSHFWQLQRFYRRAYKELRTVLRPGTVTVFHDGFRPLLFTGSLWPHRQYPVMMDVHWYGFPLERTRSFKKYLQYSQLLRLTMIRIAQLWQPIVVGEWSSVLPQRFFDERPRGEHMTLLKENITMQQDVYKKTAGSMYWNYKAEGDGMWNYKWLVENGVLTIE